MIFCCAHHLVGPRARGALSIFIVPDGTFYLAGRRYRSVVRPVQGEADGYQICVEELSNDCPDVVRSSPSLQEADHGTRDSAFADRAHNAEEEDHILSKNVGSPRACHADLHPQEHAHEVKRSYSCFGTCNYAVAKRKFKLMA